MRNFFFKSLIVYLIILSDQLTETETKTKTKTNTHPKILNESELGGSKQKVENPF